jgi:hypothetical protein
MSVGKNNERHSNKANHSLAVKIQHAGLGIASVAAAAIAGS